MKKYQKISKKNTQKRKEILHMILINMGIQSILFKLESKDEKKRETFLLRGNEYARNAPEWIRHNRQALRLKREEQISFEELERIEPPRETTLPPILSIEELKVIAYENKIILGDNLNNNDLEELIIVELDITKEQFRNTYGTK